METLVFSAQIEQYRITHARQVTDVSRAARFRTTPSDKTVGSSIEDLPRFMQRDFDFETITFYISGIKETGTLLRRLGLATGSEELSRLVTHDAITVPGSEKFTWSVIEELSDILDLPILDVEFSKMDTVSSFPCLTREVDAEVDLLKAMPNIFPFFLQANNSSY
ncbi:MAG: hypothetical protein ABH967_00220 [Patescibacteria group bacterium]